MDPIKEPTVVLITGCSSGLGRGLAEKLHKQHDSAGRPKFRVVATARSTKSLTELAEMGVYCIDLDVTSDASVDSCISQVLKDLKRIDILVNNAGLSAVGPVVEQPLSELELVLNTNVVGVVRVTQAVVPHMMRNRSGLVINIGSVVSAVTTPWSGAYSASKAALLSLTKAMRLELAPFNVHATYAMAGAIRSSLAENIMARTAFDTYSNVNSLYHRYADAITGRAGMSQADKSIMEAEDVAEQILSVINKSYPVGHAAPPNWFCIGGNATLYFLLGMCQAVFGWPMEGFLSKKFGLNK